MSNSERFTDTGMTSVFYNGVNSERERIIKLLESQSHDLLFEDHETSSCCLCTYLRLIRGEQESARTHENETNPRFADPEILEIRTNARKEEAE